MKGLISAAAVAATAAGGASAGGIDRAGQPVTILFKDGNYAEVSVTTTRPDVTGEDLPQSPPGFPFPLDTGHRYSNVAKDFTYVNFGIKYDVNEKLTFALTGSEDFGGDIKYDGDPMTSMLGGTSVDANTYALALIARYKFTENWALHGGVRRSNADGEIHLSGLAYGGVSSYNVKFDDSVAYGYLLGGSYEIPQYAFRLAVTYNSKISHKLGTQESLRDMSLGDSDKTTINLPQTVNVDFQTGIAEDTLLFGSFRWAEWSDFKIAPEQFETITGSGLVDLKDTTTWTVGVGHRFTERFAASVAYQYEGPTDKLISPLAPINGFSAVVLGASYRIDQIELSGGLRYAWLGDATPETGTPDVARADFSNNNAVSLGLRLGYYF